MINFIRGSSHIFIIIVFLDSVILRQDFVIGFITNNNLPIGIRQILFSFLLAELISLVSSLYFWLISFFSGVKPIVKPINELVLGTNANVTNFLEKCIFGAQLFSVLMLLVIIKLLKDLGFGKSPIIREIGPIIWNFLENLEKKIFSGIKDDNKKNPPENNELSNLPTPIGVGPTDNSTIINIQKQIKILKPKLPRRIRVIRVVLKKIVKKLKF